MYKKKLWFYLVLIMTGFSIQAQVNEIKGDTILVGYTEAPPFIIETKSGLEGINVWLWERVANDLNLEYQLVPMAFSNMLQSLNDDVVDLSINPLTITSERNKVMDFSTSFFASHTTIAVAKTSAFQKLIGFLKGFFNINFLKGFLVLLAIIMSFGLLGWYFERQKNPKDFRNGIAGIWDGLWWSAVTLTTVGYGDKAPKSRGGKITALILMFGGLLFISGLTASIASSLTVNQINNNPNSFNEFKELPVGTIKNTGSFDFLKERFFKDISVHDNVESGLKSLQNGDIKAFIYDEPILKYRLKEEKAFKKLQLLPVKFNVQFYAFGLSKNNTDLKAAISQKILEIIETQEWEIILHEYGITEL